MAGEQHIQQHSAHQVSAADRKFRAAFESGDWPTDAFDHAAHIRLAYIYLCEQPVNSAQERIVQAIRGYLAHHGLPADKFHVTLTRAWMLAVHHFMAQSPPSRSAAAFLAANPRLRDSRIMLTHYSEARLFSPDARSRLLAPDRQLIPTSEMC